MNKLRYIFRLCVMLTVATVVRALEMSYAPLMNGAPEAALSVYTPSIDRAQGIVVVNGFFAKPTSTPFTFDWGDGTTSKSWFPGTHAYADKSGNYLVKVSAVDSAGARYSTDSAVIRFGPVSVTAVSLPADLAVSLPTATPSIVSTTGWDFPTLTPITTLSATYPRAVMEQVLTAAAAIEYNLAGGDVYRQDGTFRQYMVTNPTAAGAFSLWFLSPAVLVAAPSYFEAAPGWSSLFHEMGHNVTLNMPASYRFGGRSDGNGNAIYSETMAQIFQHVTAFALVKNAAAYGIPDSLAAEIRASAYSSFGVLRDLSAPLRNGTKPFAVWNDPSTDFDETLPTFTTAAFEFFRQSEPDGSDYVQNATRLCSFLRHFNPTWHASWDQYRDTPAATSFRSTLMVSAISSSLNKDLRSAYRKYGFAVEDATYSALMKEVENITTPILVGQVAAQSVKAGTPASFSAMTSGESAVSYQWSKDGIPVPGATNATLTIPSVTTSDLGKYSVAVSNLVGTVVSNAADLSIGNPPGAWISNLSVRTTMAAAQTLIVGCSASGGNVDILVRGVGPTLATSFPQLFSSSAVMADPRLTLFLNGGGTAAMANDDWNSALSTTMTALGAFPLASKSRDAAFVQSIHDGGNSVFVQGTGGGIVLVEMYSLASAGAPRLVNLSARNRVGLGDDVLIAGFSIGGSGTKKLLIRGIGPALKSFGVTNPLSDPRIELYTAANAAIANNDNWDSALKATSDAVGAFTLPAGSQDAALLVTLNAGAAYTVVVRGSDGGTGEALVEVYEVP